MFITERQGTLADVIYLFPYFSHRINAFKWKTGDFFEQNTRSTPSVPFFFFKLIITVSIVVFDHANHTRKKRSTMGNDQFSRTDSLLFNLKIEASVLLDLVIQIQPFQSGCTLKPDVSVR